MRAYRATAGGAAIIRECRARYLADPTHAEQNRARVRLARECEYGVGTALPQGYENYVFEAFERRCAACGTDGDLELDHHRPLESGYALLHNAVPLCRSCNARKGSRDPLAFYGAWRDAEIAVALYELRERLDGAPSC